MSAADTAVRSPGLGIEANGINVIDESERKGTPAQLFWPWCASNVSVLAVSYGSFTMQRMRPVIDRLGESRTNDEVAAALAARLGLPAASFDTCHSSPSLPTATSSLSFDTSIPTYLWS